MNGLDQKGQESKAFLQDSGGVEMLQPGHMGSSRPIGSAVPWMTQNLMEHCPWLQPQPPAWGPGMGKAILGLTCELSLSLWAGAFLPRSVLKVNDGVHWCHSSF